MDAQSADPGSRPAADLNVLIDQLKLVISNPEVVAAAGAERQQILQLAREAAVAIEEPFETVQRLAYSVRICLLAPERIVPLGCVILPENEERAAVM